MLDEVLRSVAAKGRTIVMTSHDLLRAEDLATRFDICRAQYCRIVHP